MQTEDAAIGFGDFDQAAQGLLHDQIQIGDGIQFLRDLIELIEQVFFKLHFLHLRRKLA